MRTLLGTFQTSDNLIVFLLHTGLEDFPLYALHEYRRRSTLQMINIPSAKHPSSQII